MAQIRILGDGQEELTFDGMLMAEMEVEHQHEPRHPINTETVRLYKGEDGRWVLSLMYQFEGFDPHHFEYHVGDNPQAILAGIPYPTATTITLINASQAA
jgi:hypothetical protein